MGAVSIVDIITLAFSVIAAGFAAFTYRANVAHDRKIDTLDAYNRLQEQALDDLQMYMPAEVREIVKNKRSGEYKRLSSYEARIEHFAVGVEQKIYDRKIVYELSNGFLNKVIRARVDIVLDVKEQVGKGGHYAYIRWLYEWMEKEEKRRTRREELLKNPLYKGWDYFLKVGRKILKI